MPTINQLVHKNRKDKVRKSKAPVLGVGLNTIKKKATDTNSPQFVYQMEKKLILIFQELDTTYKNIVLY